MKVISYLFFYLLFLVIFIGWLPQDNFNIIANIMTNFISSGFTLISVLTLLCAFIPVIINLFTFPSACDDVLDDQFFYGSSPQTNWSSLSDKRIDGGIHVIAFWWLRHKKIIQGERRAYWAGPNYKKYRDKQNKKWEKFNSPPSAR